MSTMELILWFEKKKLTGTISTPISIKDIALNAKIALNKPNNNFIVFSSKFEVLSETLILQPNEKKKEFYLLMTQEYSKASNENNDEKIEDMIMKVTGANQRLVYKKPDNNPNQFNFYEQLALGESNLNRLSMFIQSLDQNAWNGIDDRQISHGIEVLSIIPNQEMFNEFKEMGFQEDKIKEALIKSENDKYRATEILLNEEYD